MKKIAQVFVLFIFVLPSSAAVAQDPYIVDDAGITDKGTVQDVNWFSHGSKGENLATATIAAQIFDNFEATLQPIRDVGHDDNETAVVVQGKYLWHAGTPTSWASSLEAGTNYDIIDDKISDVYAAVPVTFNVTPGIQLNLDGGWNYVRDDDRNYATWGANVAWQATTTVSLVAEEFGRNTGLPGQQLGINWQPAGQSFVVTSLVYGHDIDGTAANWVTAALALTF